MSAKGRKQGGVGGDAQTDEASAAQLTSLKGIFDKECMTLVLYTHIVTILHDGRCFLYSL